MEKISFLFLKFAKNFNEEPAVVAAKQDSLSMILQNLAELVNSARFKHVENIYICNASAPLHALCSWTFES